MTRTFLHDFDPPTASPVAGPTVSLEVSDIEDAGIREVLQTPGAAYGAWSILDTLLEPTGPGTPFVFKERLGQAREVTVVLSGLFGRFVARAYLEQYFDLAIFAHLGSRTIDLDRRRRIKVKRLFPGDFPDWIACKPDLSSLTVAEAKGCHDVAGPAKSLDRAWAQAGRIDLTAGERKITVKRIAIATRWANAKAGPPDALLSVRDPVDEGESVSPEEKDALFIGLLRLHIASLIARLGHAELAGALQRLTQQTYVPGFQGDLQDARALLDAAPVREVEEASTLDGLVGGIVTRSRPVTDADVTRADQETLARLNLRPVFVGIKRDLIRAAIDAEPQLVRSRLAHKMAPDEFARPDRAGGWIVPLGEKRHIKSGK
ncbi:hypothetical protein [Bradyrhizobium nanningense]|uniref:hypothetical protein n=1 Tax=Bradyrhizobium nanningense TaxID=1325118 RepID=UPI001008B73D|nr:hypothetical protein [Bradyrhizobium nanningense]